MEKNYVTPKVKISWHENSDLITSSGEALIVDTQSDGLFEGGFTQS